MRRISVSPVNNSSCVPGIPRNSFDSGAYHGNDQSIESHEIRPLDRAVSMAAEGIILVPLDEVKEDRVNVGHVVVPGRCWKWKHGGQSHNYDRGNETSRRNEVRGNEVGRANEGNSKDTVPIRTNSGAAYTTTVSRPSWDRVSGASRPDPASSPAAAENRRCQARSRFARTPGTP